jgi:hypothetical protein
MTEPEFRAELAALEAQAKALEEAARKFRFYVKGLKSSLDNDEEASKPKF